MNLCGTIREIANPKRFCICDLNAGHGGAHYDSTMKASWDDVNTWLISEAKQSGIIQRCPVCWCLLLGTDAKSHAHWHEKLRAAVGVNELGQKLGEAR